MTDFVMQRNRTIATLSGHVIKFVKGEPSYVPPEAHREVMNAGAVPTQENFEILEEDNTTTTNAGDLLSIDERKQAIIKAFELLKSRNQRGDFGADGKPHPKAVSTICGFLVDAKERAVVWAEYLDSDA